MVKQSLTNILQQQSIIISVLIFSVLSSYGQSALTVSDVFNKVNQYYASLSNYTFNVKYALYPNASATTHEEFYTGKVIKKDAEHYYSKINQTEFIQLPSVFIKVNHQEKALLYMEQPAKDTPSTLTDMSALLEGFERTTVEKEKGEYICNLYAHNITTLPYSRVTVHINAKNYNINKQVLYLSASQTTKKEDGTPQISNPRLEISLTAPKNYNIEDNTFVLSKYITKQTTRVLPSAALSAYQVISPQL